MCDKELCADDKRLPGKYCWPELLGVLATVAAQTITRERPDVSVEVLPPGSTITPNFNPNRVRLFIDNQGIVRCVPAIG